MSLEEPVPPNSSELFSPPPLLKNGTPHVSGGLPPIKIM